MLQPLASTASDGLTRAQLALFNELSDEIQLTPDDRCRALDLDRHVWAAWLAFMRNGALPPSPSLPEMLRRLGKVAFDLSCLAG